MNGKKIETKLYNTLQVHQFKNDTQRLFNNIYRFSYIVKQTLCFVGGYVTHLCYTSGTKRSFMAKVLRFIDLVFPLVTYKHFLVVLNLSLVENKGKNLNLF